MFTKLAITLILMSFLTIPSLELEYPSGYRKLDRWTRIDMRKQNRVYRKTERTKKRNDKFNQ